MPANKLAKKAAKKVAAKAAKKAAKKGAKPAGHDLRRAYEHLHRVKILHGGVGEEALGYIDTMSRLAQGALASGEDKTAAELLRGAEHLAFGSLATKEGDASAAASLVGAAHREYDQLTERAAAHWAEREGTVRGVAGIYKYMRAEAKAAMDAGALHRALEFARGAEALTHVQGGLLQLSSGATRAALPRR